MIDRRLAREKIPGQTTGLRRRGGGRGWFDGRGHNQLVRALSDGAQALPLDEYKQMVREVHAIHDVIA